MRVRLTIDAAGVPNEQHVRRVLADEKRQGEVLDRYTQYLVLGLIVLLALARVATVVEVAGKLI